MQTALVQSMGISASIQPHSVQRTNFKCAFDIQNRQRVVPVSIKRIAGASAARHQRCAVQVSAALVSFEASPLIQVNQGTIPAVAGVYAVYDPQGTLQFVGVSRKVAVSVATHLEALPELVGSVKVLELPEAGKEELTEAWKEWIQEAVNLTGSIPPGNAPGEKMWQQRRPRAAKPEIRLTPGKGVDDLTCSIGDLLDQVVKSNKIVIFLKGTRTEPACGFSHKALTILSQVAGQEFEVVNVLDEVYNPGVRDAIKEYSQWPTIPQIFINGEFVGGSDILEQMHSSGELAQMIKG